MTPRQRRLHSDFEKLTSEFKNHTAIKVEFNKEGNDVPEKYFVTFTGITGIKLSDKSTKENKIVEKINVHKCEIYLHSDYPRIKPQCYLLTELFHPNFRMAHPHEICIGDYWSSGENLADIIYQIGEMIMYQNYNVKNPLNGVASKWAKENEGLFPLDKTNLHIGDVEIIIKDKI